MKKFETSRRILVPVAVTALLGSLAACGNDEPVPAAINTTPVDRHPSRTEATFHTLGDIDAYYRNDRQTNFPVYHTDGATGRSYLTFEFNAGNLYESNAYVKIFCEGSTIVTELFGRPDTITKTAASPACADDRQITENDHIVNFTDNFELFISPDYFNVGVTVPRS